MYEPIYVKEKYGTILAERAYKGKYVSLYGTHTIYVSTGPNGTVSGGVNFATCTSENYFLLRKGYNQAFYLGTTTVYGKNIRKTAMKYFADCQELITKMQSRV